MNLREEIANAINRNSAENGSDTPDFILAEFLTDCLAAYDRAVAAREKWYGRAPTAVPVVDDAHERALALEDAAISGIGFLVNGCRVDPSLVQAVRPEAATGSRREDWPASEIAQWAAAAPVTPAAIICRAYNKLSAAPFVPMIQHRDAPPVTTRMDEADNKAAQDRVEQVIQDLGAGRVIPKQVERLGDAVGRAKRDQAVGRAVQR